MRLPPPLPKPPLDASLSLINIVFLLLLFFIATGTVVYQQDTTVTPPTSFLLITGKPPVDAIYVDADGALSFRGRKQDAAAIAEAVRTGSDGDGATEGLARTFQVVADRRLKAKTLLAIIAELKQQGMANLSIVTVRDVGT